MDGIRTAYSARAAARELGTSAPRVLRAIDHLGMRVKRSPGGRVRLSRGQIQRLRAHLGSTPSDASLSRAQARLLAALDRSPRGVVSIRALAQRAGVSPTTAAKHLPVLRDRGLVSEETRWVAEGRARRRTIISLDDSASDWRALAPAVRSVQLPSPPASREDDGRVPRSLDHLFWNVADSQKDVASAGPIIARRLIETSDLDGLAWGLSALSATDWEHAASTRGISATQRAMAENFAAAAKQARSR